MIPDTIEKCTVWCDLVDIQGAGVSQSMHITFNQKSVRYKDATLAMNGSIVQASVAGRFEVDLIETDNMEEDAYYIIKVAGNTYNKKVPLAANANLFDLPDAVI